MKASVRSLFVPTLREEFDAAVSLEGMATSTRVRAVAPALPLPTTARAGAVGQSLRIVGILAFCQSLLFLILWLFLCAGAGAASKPVAEFNPQLQLSSYHPTKERDPFQPADLKVGEAKVVGAAPLSFTLQGILYDDRNPAAMINDQLVTLNKSVTINVGKTAVDVTAVEITRDQVVLAMAGQRIELRLESNERVGSSVKH